MREIAEGWANNILRLDQVVEGVADERMKICTECVHISTKHKTNRPDVHCTECGCTLAAKTRSLTSSCPIGKWTEFKKEKYEKVHNKKDSSSNAPGSSQ